MICVLFLIVALGVCGYVAKGSMTASEETSSCRICTIEGYFSV